MPWVLLMALALASRLREPWARAAVARLQLAAGCGFVPLPPAATLSVRRPTQRECMKFVAGSIPR
jgi:hypothetical protein